MSNRDIESHMNKIYGLDVSPEMVTRITDKILPIAKEWQNRPLNELYPIIYLDGGLSLYINSSLAISGRRS
jgi:transposase-like protein